VKRRVSWQVVIASHSWGDNVFRAFMQYMDSQDVNWVENNVHTYINIAGPVLGVPKSIPAFLSGESRTPRGARQPLSPCSQPLGC